MKLIVTILTLVLLSACNPSKQFKKLQAQQDEYNKNHPPRVDTVTIMKYGADSSGYFKAIADSMRAVKALTKTNVLLQYRDTCTSAAELFEVGYQMGFAVGQGAAIVRVDTFTRDLYPYDLINAYERKAGEQLAKNKEQSQTITQQKNTKTRLLFWCIGLAAFIILSIVLLLKTKRL